ncbi:M48 family metallopeptidase [Cocleimonas flava]|uniref:STE24 endopeptidase n=1 Tax=Cocleimonas flava TaxID=634765 RepID=A0A4R1ESC8_9GAMM|nr:MULTISPECIES: M48 family metallopeptidase [Cocleimonas]MEB8432376.1 M48 family metallopeptidase [Cocleimonas sp. KMM 6892]MEC4715235.1 M48 family metallopeptidase [Cocleimonas sp. KMM 6895]MEC4745146.1 M48 family metallopeptidase [Cocleimonas sp. KMM 6896]TCJ82812.1 STE24 endopeptidase [Cocleimonas flava]
MHTFTFIFLALLIITTGVQLWLSLRNAKHVAQHRSAVPEEFADKITLEEHQKAADYTRTKGSFGRFNLILSAVVLLLWTLGGGLELLDNAMRSFSWGPLTTGVAVIIGFSLISSIIDIPTSLYSTFVIEEKFGFNKSTLKVFFIDMFKGAALSVVIGIPLIMLVLWLMESAGSLWWLYAWVALTAFSILMMWAYPKFIAPIFNKFKPLEEGEVLNRITTLLDRTGFNSDGVFVMDGSKRSSHGNAYFTGFGKTKRIVFFDTLLKHLTPTQVEAVLAHELGHFKHKHVLKGMIVSMTMTLVGFAVLAWLMQQQWFYNALGVSQPSTYMALLLFILVSPAFTFFIGPIMSRWSRKHEFEADSFAAQQSDSAELISALVGLYKKNAGTLTPDPLYSAFYDSHPPASIRIAHLKQAG